MLAVVTLSYFILVDFPHILQGYFTGAGPPCIATLMDMNQMYLAKNTGLMQISAAWSVWRLKTSVNM